MLSMTKCRDLPKMRAVHLERDDNPEYGTLLCKETKPVSKMPPEEVAKIIEEDFNGRCKGRDKLAERIRKYVKCSFGAARNYIEEAMRKQPDGRVYVQNVGGNGKPAEYIPGTDYSELISGLQREDPGPDMDQIPMFQ